MNKIEINIRDIISFIIIALVAIIVIFLGLAYIGNQSEIYNDIIIEMVALYGTNHTGELSVFWATLFAGIPILLIVQYLMNKNKRTTKQNQQVKTVIAIETVVNISNIIFYIITGSYNQILVGIAILSFINYLVYPEKEKHGLILNIITYYFLLALCTIYNKIGGTILANSTILFLATAVIDLVILYIEKKKKIMNKAIILMQIVIPFILLVYMCQRYIYQNEIYYFDIPILAKVLILGTIILMVIYVIYQTIKNWKKANDLPIDKIIFTTTCMIIFVINSININTSLSVPSDLHHAIEEVISYQQIIEKGQKPYEDYSPVSGLFPVLIGGILEIFGGNVTIVNLAHTIFMSIFVMLSMYILTKHLKKEDCLIIGMLFCFPSYDRVVFILITLLILLLPGLIKNKNLWLKLWIWLCFIGGLYYPSFGMAVLLGTLPFGIIQLIGLIKGNDFKQKLKTKRFYIEWVICLIPIIISIPLLFNMAKHILIYSEQTELADGISVLGQETPESFLPYLSNINSVRTVIYYGIRYMLPAAVVWLFIIMLIKLIKNQKIKEVIKDERFLAISSAIITLIIAYIPTIIRNDFELILSRTTYIIIPIGGIFLYLIIKKYLQQNLASYILIGMITGLTIILGNSPMTRLDSEFIYAYNMSDEYEVISEDLTQKYPRLGTGFILKEDIEMFEDYYNRASALLKYDENLKFIAWGELGVYYTLDLTTVGQPSLYAAKDLKTHQEIIEAIEKQKPVIGLDLSTSLLNYYLYNWLLTTDQYVYDSNYQAFLPIELFNKIYGDDVKPTDKRDIELYMTDVGRVSNSLGKSLETLEKRMKKLDVKIISQDTNIVQKNEYEYKLIFDKEISSNTADFMYIEFDVNGDIYETQKSIIKKLAHKQYPNNGIYVISKWGENKENSMLSILGDGKLLIPLGSNVNWLLNKHDSINIWIQNTDKKIDIKNVCFYKLQTEGGK